MEKRFVLFLVLAIGVIFGHLAIVQFLSPPRPQQALKNKQGESGKESAAKEEKRDAIPLPPPSDTSAEKPKAEEPAVVAPAESAEEKPSPQQWASLGSYAPNSPYPMLVTFSNRGAAIERVELTERTPSGKLRYRNLEERSGYLGDLALSWEKEGCRVNVVGDGTPAQQAKLLTGSGPPGIQVGDLLTSIDKQPVQQPADLTAFLHEKRPGNKVVFSVRRTVDGVPKALDLEVKLDDRPFELIRPEAMAKNSPVPNPPSLLMSIVHVGSREMPLGDAEIPGLPSLRTRNWEMRRLEGSQPAIEFRFHLDPASLKKLGIDGDLEIVKRYRLSPLKAKSEEAGSEQILHDLHVELEFVNRAAQPLPLAYRLDGPNGLTLEGWWYLSKINPQMFASAGARDVIYQTDGGLQQLVGCPEIVKYAQKNPKTPDRPLFAEGDDEKYRTLQYAGVDSQFFLAALLPQGKDSSSSRVYRRAATNALSDLVAMEKARSNTTNVSFYLTSPVITVPPGQSVRRDFVLYAGPKEPTLLAPYGLGEAIYYGWFWWVAKPLSRLLHFFYGIARNYGIAIIMLTVLVRGCMFPISRKAAKNAVMMQELAPEMKKIAEKYKNDMEKRARAQQDLFRKHNYNPFSGCWLMFLQLPVFIGLYRSLAVDIELRQAPLIPGIEWASNLAGPDMLYQWDQFLPAFFGSETGMLGPYLNVLPIITMVLFLVQQQLFTPPATDEQTRMQMQMMKFMTVFIGFMFFKVASGLCIYFIASSLWSVGERLLVPKPKPGEITETPERRPGLLERLRSQFEKDGGSKPDGRRRPRRVR